MMSIRVRPLLALGGASVVALATVASPAPGQAQEVVAEQRTQYQQIRAVEVAGDLEQPWGLAFLPDGSQLVTERPGRLLHIADGERTQVSGLPQVSSRNQGGLLDVVLHPDFEENGWVYLTYSKADEAGQETVPALVRARLDGHALVDLEHLFESNTYTSPGRHYGSRILFLEDGTLLMTIGDRGAQPERAQDPMDHSGSVVRLNADGTVPADNPFVGDDSVADEIWSWGHRNIQGIVLHPGTGEVWATEHGPRGGDELNLIRPGHNYGWPTVSLGRDYRTQEPWSDRREHGAEMTPPVWEFLPTLAPSGLAVVPADAFASTWDHNLLAGGLASQRIQRIVLEEGEVVHMEEILPFDLGRIRDVRTGPDNHIWVLTGENEGGLYRLEPVG
ncbi:MAG: PQQ-dependent sugar dehydrogenase [Gemmatimonadales bacterium]|nr:MAG: PQQ-dependent sugar dehydrogenase [Gemmatimonadales bacterium]